MRKVVAKFIGSVSNFIASSGLRIFTRVILLIIGIAIIVGIRFLAASSPFPQSITLNDHLSPKKLENFLKKHSQSRVLKNVTIGDYVLDEVSIKPSTDKNGSRIFNIAFKAYGGTGELKLTLSPPKKPFHLKAHLKLSDVEASLIPRHEKNPLQEGTMSLKVSLTTKGKSPESWLSYLNGTWKLNIQEGTLNLIDIKKVIQILENLDLRSLLHLRKVIKEPGPLPFDQISGQGVVENGEVQTSHLKLSSPDITANTASLTADLVKDSLAGKTTVSFCNVDIPPVEMSCSGHLKNPKVHFDAFRWFGKLIEQKAEKKVKSTIEFKISQS